MNETILRVQMLGELTLTLGEKKISEGQNRSKKMWALLAYLLYHRHRTVTQDELLELLWGSGSGHNPVSAMKTAMHRTRALMDDLSPSLGHQLIIKKGGGYGWNNDYPMELDIDAFEQLCHSGGDSDPSLLEDRLQALQLYRGNFLNRMSSELWVIPPTTYYQNLFIQTSQKILPYLKESAYQDQATEICRNVLVIDPYNESIYRYLIQTKLDQGDQQGAMSLYEDLNHRLSSDFGVMPSEETRALYRKAMQSVDEQYLPPELIQNQLREETGLKGATICDYKFFQLLCHVQCRAMARTQMDAHVALFTLVDHSSKPLTKATRTQVMMQLEERIQNSLRRGDTMARCSASQFVALLPNANYENSCMVCERVIQSYFKAYPQPRVSIQYLVHGLEPYA
ncbi:MAG: winged helix-turn-helix domain-containing protein [Firmicutes bacterium]|nr:winged helix-turn-helix domain-containing protein [Bacillota bacterium]